ncbi:MAG TPA: chemotaxis response regulator protein-glutamate methylesterase [Gemmatimonadales bacterium]|nr:chemotaxis response regulator protein-glutamate methylesterase [Gemmatimonadales bacterium]
MPKIRVLVVDDAVVVRKIVTDVLAADPEIEVVGTAANGRLALGKLALLTPDLVTLDIEMPELDGLQTLVEIRKTHRRLPVIMFSTLTERAAAATLDALARGASDYVTKPSNVGSVQLAQERIRAELIPKIKALCGRKPVVPVAATRPAAAPVKAVVTPRPALPVRLDVLAIGVSTGGPNALAEIIPALPAEYPLPVVIVQHMPPLFTRFLAERLSSISALTVREGEDGAVLEPGTVWVAPGNYHMTLRRDADRIRLALNQEPHENSCRPAVDPLFRSVAEVYGNRALGLVLTGMGHDGLAGAEVMRQAGGTILAQDEATAVVWGMPGAVVSAGLADLVLPLDQVATELVLRAQTGRLAKLPAARPSSSLAC